VLSHSRVGEQCAEPADGLVQLGDLLDAVFRRPDDPRDVLDEPLEGDLCVGHLGVPLHQRPETELEEVVVGSLEALADLVHRGVLGVGDVHLATDAPLVAHLGRVTARGLRGRRHRRGVREQVGHAGVVLDAGRREVDAQR
jgi:hypothetical protein